MAARHRRGRSFDAPAGAGVFGLCGRQPDARRRRRRPRRRHAFAPIRVANIEAGAARLAELARQRASPATTSWRGRRSSPRSRRSTTPRRAPPTSTTSTRARGRRVVDRRGRHAHRVDRRARRDRACRTSRRARHRPPTTRARSGGPSPNYNSRGGTRASASSSSTRCEGTYAGCWGWLRTAPPGVSAHYVVNESGSEITQLVRESNRAWHVAATYECANAGNAQCNKNGVSTNNFSVGIEHAGLRVAGELVERHHRGVGQADAATSRATTASPRDRNHIVVARPAPAVQPHRSGPELAVEPLHRSRPRACCGDNGGGGGGGGGRRDDHRRQQQRQQRRERREDRADRHVDLVDLGRRLLRQRLLVREHRSRPRQPATFWFYLPAAGTKTVDALVDRGHQPRDRRSVHRVQRERRRGRPQARQPAAERQPVGHARHVQLQRRLEQGRAVALDEQRQRRDRRRDPGEMRSLALLAVLAARRR